MHLNKYSGKLFNFINNNFKIYKNNQGEQINDKYIIDFLTKSFSDSMPIDIKKIYSANIKKIHDVSEMPLVHAILYELKLKNNISNKVIDIKKILRSNNIPKKIYDIIFKPSKDRILLHKLLYENDFISTSIVHHAESSDLTFDHYRGNNSDIYIYSPNFAKEIDIQLVSRIISFFRIFTKKSDLYVNIVLFMGKNKKFIPSNSQMELTPNEINSGSSIEGTIIMIWREEEIYKVLIHELIHYFGIDFHTSDKIYPKINSLFSQNFIINGIDRVNESYTEILALTINSIIFSHIFNVNFYDVIAYEKLFSYFQVAKICTIFNYKSYSELKKKGIKQSTSACSYYVIKCIFLEKYNEIVQYLNQNGLYILNNDAYVDLYKKIVKNDTLDEKIIDNMIKFIYDNKNEQFVYKTMRMSLFSLNN